MQGAIDTVVLAPLPGNLLYGRVFIPPVYGPEIPLGTSLDIPFFLNTLMAVHLSPIQMIVLPLMVCGQQVVLMLTLKTVYCVVRLR